MVYTFCIWVIYSLILSILRKYFKCIFCIPVLAYFSIFFFLLLLQAWLNEKFAPELLECKADIVDCIMEQITEMEENIQRAKKGSSIISIHKMEVRLVHFCGYIHRTVNFIMITISC